MEAKQIRQLARQNLSPSWGISIGVAAIAALLGGLLIGSNFLPQVNYSWDRIRESHDFLRSVRISTSSGFFGLASFLLGGVLQLGYARFLLKQYDGQEPQFNDLFSQFDRFGAGFAQALLRGLYTFLWSLLFIIPGIIAALRYSMTPYIMAEHPELTASEAINRSKELMEGHKMDLFILQLTFLGWDILCALTLNLGNLALNPYKNAAITVFYRNIISQKGYYQM